MRFFNGKFWRRQWLEWRLSLFVIVFVVVPVKSSFADWNWVPSSSMNPTILEGDLVFVNKAAYDLRVPLTWKRVSRWSDPQAGDIVVLFSPDDGIRLVKRVIGVPGDTLEMKNNILFLNGKRLKYDLLPDNAIAGLEPDLKARSVFARETVGSREHAVMAIPAIATPRRSFGPVQVPESKYFVMGDNRDVSQDSRYFGFADREQVIGEATRVIVSFNILDSYQPRLGRFFSRLD
ncbi:signal peptidase I [Pelagicoccus sp. SDUM812002]|uniref:signal peptidase I n=1 Tax=Pelagicoccus sp. SDUM812002 TaxID=3041266 RepID=UPI00280D34BB|nr:signal peptidase I [Pelagicoccus sp. SDUM812002]MDQ8185203.1 signal peptidase I [Pelagicoccus sp. SDUM812002]